MEKLPETYLSRRAFLWKFLTVPAAMALVACQGLTTNQPTTVALATDVPTTSNPQILAPTSACGDDDDLTFAQTEGPYFTPNSPERASLVEPGMTGTVMAVSGVVLSTNCQPIANALLDFWHADDAGVYDNVGYRLRGHQFTDEQGRYQLETIMPGLYPGRTRHFHVKVQAPNQPVLTTQLYFPNEASNASDGIYSSDLLMTVEDHADGKQATFDFVLEIT
jgi:protocatechuate 3,4-dioxygenase beta subunit